MDNVAIALFVGLIITILSYMTVPFILKSIHGVYNKKEANIIAIFNSLLVGAIWWKITSYSNNTKWDYTTACFYYFINIWLLTRDNKGEKSEEKVKKSSKNKGYTKDSKNKFCKFCGGEINNNGVCKICNHKFLILNFKKITLYSSITLIIVGLVSLFVVEENRYSQLEKKYNENEEELVKLQNQYSNLEDNYNQMNLNYTILFNGKTSTYISSKLNFFDNSIVFVPVGTNYYYKYDCYMQKFPSTNYYAFNKESAIAKGYWQGSC